MNIAGPGTPAAMDADAVDVGREAKMICVPHDPAYEGVTDLGDLPEHQLTEIGHFFDIYRDLDPGKDVRYDGRDGLGVALRTLADSRSRRYGR